MQESSKDQPEMSIEKQRNKKSSSSIKPKTEKNSITKESDERRKVKKSKGKIVFDEEFVSKYEVQNLTMEKDYDMCSEEDYGANSNIEVSITDENRSTTNKKRKKKKRKIEEQLNHQTSDVDISNEEASEQTVSKKKKEENVTSHNDDEDASEEGVDADKSEDKKKQSIRARKRTKHLKLLEEKKLKSELNMQQKCLNYLSQWKHDKSTWKFEKLKQVWLLQNLYDDAKIPDEFWDTTVKYFSNAKGKVKEVLLTKTLKIIESSGENDENCVDTKYERARHLAQNLQE